jgi:hypothetical protein
LLGFNGILFEYKTHVETDLSRERRREAHLEHRVSDPETEVSFDISIRQLMAGDTSTQLHKAQ